MLNWVLLAQLLSALYLLNGKQNSKYFFYSCDIPEEDSTSSGIGGVHDTLTVD